MATTVGIAVDDTNLSTRGAEWFIAFKMSVLTLIICTIGAISAYKAPCIVRRELKGALVGGDSNVSLYVLDRKPDDDRHASVDDDSG